MYGLKCWPIVKENNPVIGGNVEIQDFAVIGKNGSTPAVNPVTIGDNTRILTGAIIYNGCRIGKNCLIADYADIRENCVIGNHSVIGRKVCVENNTRIGSQVTIQTQSHITANAVIEDYVFFGPQVTMTNDRRMWHPRHLRNIKVEFKGATVKRGARIGAHSVLCPNIVVGEEAFVIVGSVVFRDVPPRTVIAGNPARAVGKVPEEELLLL